MSDLYIESRLQAIKDIASTSCSDIKDADNIAGFCDEIYSAIPKLDKIVEELKKHKDTTDLTTVDEEMVVGFTIYQGAFNDAIDKAIEIVKAGGENE